nr:UvrD-helicase domain-containing protein [Trueperella sp.]
MTFRFSEEKSKRPVITAVAGSGKTRHIVNEVDRKIQDGVSPSRVLVVSLTNATVEHFESVCEHRVEVRTLHSAVASVLASVGYSWGDIPPEVAQVWGARDALVSLRMPTSAAVVEQALMIESRANSRLMGPSEWGEDDDYPPMLPFSSEVVPAFLERSLIYRQRLGGVSYDDLLWLAIAAEPPEQWDVIFVDEAQDLGGLALAVLDHWALEAEVLFVGDPAQSIYGFAGASGEWMNEGLPVGELPTCWRSTRQIVEVANFLRDDGMKAISGVGDGPVPKVVTHESSAAQRTFVAALDGQRLYRRNLSVRSLHDATIHVAKGAEWDAVHVMDAASGVLPSSYALTEAQQREERRLFYVAVTRARRELYFHRVRGSDTPYIDELLDAGLVEEFCE